MKVRGLLIAVVFVASCSASTSDSEFQKLQDITSRSDFARSINDECIEEISRETRKTREELAAAIKVPVSKLPSALCGRVVRGLASGRLTREDWDALNRGKATDNLIRVIKG